MLQKLLRRLLSKKIIEQETLIFPRTVDTAKKTTSVDAADASKSSEAKSSEPVEEIDDWATVGEEYRSKNQMPKEEGFVYKGNEPTMFGDWQHKGRTTDF